MPTAARKTDEFQDSAEDKVYIVTVKGQYYASTEAGNKKTIRRYEVDVKLSAKYLDGALSFIKNNLLHPALRKKYDDYVKYRTHEIATVVSLDDPLEDLDEPKLMSKTQLLNFIQKRKLNVRVHLYPAVYELRAAVVRAVEDPKEFALEQDTLTKNKEERIMVAKELQDLNPDLEYEY